mgnify:CR=1 FL=1
MLNIALVAGSSRNNSQSGKVARFLRQLAVPEALHVHFDGAGGNIGAGKDNDGSPTNRLVAVDRGYDRITGMVVQSAIPVRVARAPVPVA